MDPKIAIRGLSVAFAGRTALRGLDLDVPQGEILGVIGPAGSGKSTLLRALNRMLEAPAAEVSGSILLDNRDINDLPLFELRRRIGLVFATPVVLPGSIYKNVTYGPRLARRHTRKELDEIVHFALASANLWDEVKDRLGDSAGQLSGGQQQRLCIARTLALKPDVVMMDEPCSGLDPISTAKIESMMLELKARYTFILVTNNTKQAARVADRTAFFLSGELVEINRTEMLFTSPRDQRTNGYISGRFG